MRTGSIESIELEAICIGLLFPIGGSVQGREGEKARRRPADVIKKHANLLG